MDTYLLLRNNKQSGPYSLQQLVNLGLKPYDLVWLEGRSAAWRYPSEVDGLKAYAPATEEQPFDRFYKKPEEKTQEKPVEKQVPQQQSTPKEETYVLKSEERAIGKQPEIQIEPQQEVVPKVETYVLPAENKTVTTSRKVFVAMPENHVPKRQTQPVFVKTPPIEEKPVIVEEKVIESKPVYTRNETIAREQTITRNEPIVPVVKEKPIPVKKEEPILDEKYSESLDDIKKRYTETYLNRKNRSKWTSTHTSVLQVFGGAILFCTLVVLAYKNFAGEDQPQSRTTLIQPDKRAINTGTVTTTPPVVPPVTTGSNKPSRKTQTKKEETDISDESLAINSEPEKNIQPVNETETAAVEKKAVMPKITEEKPAETKPKTRPVNINRLVNVQANNYKQRAFGGVMNLELTVNNNSKFELDKVTVELQYLKPSEQPIKTEIIVFSSIEANGSKTLKIPDYLRGVKVSYRVMDIESTQYDRQTAGL